jgi:hypothetical protein
MPVSLIVSPDLCKFLWVRVSLFVFFNLKKKSVVSLSTLDEAMRVGWLWLVEYRRRPALDVYLSIDNEMSTVLLDPLARVKVTPCWQLTLSMKTDPELELAGHFVLSDE